MMHGDKAEKKTHPPFPTQAPKDSRHILGLFKRGRNSTHTATPYGPTLSMTLVL